MSSAPDDHHTVIGLDSMHRAGQQKDQPPEEEHREHSAQTRGEPTSGGFAVEGGDFVNPLLSLSEILEPKEQPPETSAASADYFADSENDHKSLSQRNGMDQSGRQLTLTGHPQPKSIRKRAHNSSQPKDTSMPAKKRRLKAPFNFGHQPDNDFRTRINTDAGAKTPEEQEDGSSSSSLTDSYLPDEMYNPSQIWSDLFPTAQNTIPKPNGPPGDTSANNGDATTERDQPTQVETASPPPEQNLSEVYDRVENLGYNPTQSSSSLGSLGVANLDVTSQSLQASMSKDTVTSLMTLAEVISCLSDHGCRNITGWLDTQSCSQYPISHGGFGDVFRGRLNDGSQVAIKTMRLLVDSKRRSRKSLKHAALEMYTWSKCRHQNVQPLLGLVEFRGQIGMVSTWEENGNLSEHIRLRPNVNRCLLSGHIARGLSWLHANGVIHGDLKACNVLVSKDGTPMLADFGSAVLQVHTLKFTTTTTKPATSARWAAPEVLEGQVTHSIPADIYTLGMTILETITGELPWSGKADAAVMAAVMVKKSHPERPLEHIPVKCEHGDTLWSMLRKCWAYNPGDRPHAADVQDIMWDITDEGLNRTHRDNFTSESEPNESSA
ncbi:hypothetical protein FRC12_000099 [Ceratobasidium sp. 428]|nr:hypothetical protein FRC12_000099 [Ceratobasidium sp. 428]